MRLLLVTGGSLCVALGALGMILPGLPTTPFLLLAAACYARSSDRFYRWLLGNRWFGVYLRDYRAGRGIPRRAKVLTLVWLWLTIGFTTLVAVRAWWGQATLVGVAIGVTWYVLRLKTHSPDLAPPPADPGPAGEPTRRPPH